MTNRKFVWLGSAWMTTALTIAIGAALTGTALLLPPPARAVHDEPTPFQLDGNPTKSIGGGNPAVSLLDDDWDNVFNLGTPPYDQPRRNPANGIDPGEAFVTDTDVTVVVNGKTTVLDQTAFIKSNKDIDETDTWDWDASSISPPKDDITNAFAKAYKVDHDSDVNTPDHLIVYFGSDRFADDGDSAMGYWFFRGPVAPGPNKKFTGKHTVGDVLIQIDYRGNGNNEIEVFRWVGTGGNAGNGALQRLALGTSTNTSLCTAANTNVTPAIPEDAACITTNTIDLDSPWTFVPKGSDSVGTDRFPPRVFMEGGFDVTALVGNVCFQGFMAETRSSHSETAELKDFAFGNFNLCKIKVEKECVADSQIVNPSTETFTATHLVTITNDGFAGALRDVELSDTKVAAASGNTKAKTCRIKSVTSLAGTNTGLAGTNFVFDDTTDSVEVADSLGGAISVELECTSGDNPFVNGVSVKSRADVGQPQDVTASFDEDPDDTAAACQAVLNVGLTLKKWCQGDNGLATGHPMGPNPYFLTPNTDDPENPLGISVFLKAPSYGVQVCVDIELSNPSTNQKMVIDTFGDNKLGSLLPAGGLTLNVKGQSGDTFAVNTCYPGAAPDGADGVHDFVPHSATYTDTVRATGHGKIDGVTTSAGPVSATCVLCPD